MIGARTVYCLFSALLAILIGFTSSVVAQQDVIEPVTEESKEVDDETPIEKPPGAGSERDNPKEEEQEEIEQNERDETDDSQKLSQPHESKIEDEKKPEPIEVEASTKPDSEKALPSEIASSDKPVNEFELDSYVVTATRTKKKTSELPQSIDVINENDIQATFADDVTDIVKKSSTIDVIQYPGTLSGVGMRGFRPEFSGTRKHMLLLIDGRPAGATNLATIPLDNVERIEVLKGPASALYGSQAMGGVINVIRKKSTGDLGGSFTLGGGSYATWYSKVASGGAVKKYFDFDISGKVHQQLDNYLTGDSNLDDNFTQFDNGEERKNTQFKKYVGSLRVGADLFDDWRVDLTGDLFQGDDIEMPGDTAYGTVQQSQKDVHRYGGDVKLVGNIIKTNEMGLTFFASEEESENTNRYTGSGFDAVRTDPYKSYVGTVNWLGSSFQDTQYYQGHSLTLGIDYLVELEDSLSYNPDGTRKASYTPKSETNTLGFFGQLMLKLWEDRLVGNAGARLDVIELSTEETYLRDDFTPGTSNFTTFNPSAGLKLRLAWIPTE